PYSLLQEIEPELQKHGVPYKAIPKGETTWFNLKWCPACGKEGDFECGISEQWGTNTNKGYVHGYQCWHGGKMLVADVLRALGINVRDSSSNTSERDSVVQKPVKRKKLAAASSDNRRVDDYALLNEDVNAGYRRNLKNNPEAMQYLLKRGLTLVTIDMYQIGLSREEVIKDTGEVRKNVLKVPLFNSKFQAVKKYSNYLLPGVTEGVDPKRRSWMPGNPTTYYGNAVGDRKIVFVCEGEKDLWIVRQKIRGTELDDKLLPITSTNGLVVPKEWTEELFWRRFEAVYLGQDTDKAGEEIYESVRKCPLVNPFRVRVPEGMGKDWTDYFLNGGTVEFFAELIEKAPKANPVLCDDENGGWGTLDYDPIDISGVFHNGHLYYPFLTLERE
ncbi:MAG: hypothetical protein IH628_10095, partial [Proteobacteria bacterium]|nr:hypothetical protein [Pseudomonadota bacterium]